MGRLVSREDQKRIQLEMLIEIDSFCSKNGLKYSLAFGTLLGAIRHKGFIPWDDDVDIMMPLEDMKRFKETFHSDRMKYCDVDTEPHYEYAFSRVADTRTYKRRGLVEKTYGVCIDLYPVVPIFQTESERSSFFRKAELLLRVRLLAIRVKTAICSCLPLKTIPGFDRIVKSYRYYLISPSIEEPYKCYYVIAGHVALRHKMTYDFDLFDSLIKVEFEGYCFNASSQYDRYLSLRYGDYMTPPPIEERIPYHGGRYFWK